MFGDRYLKFFSPKITHCQCVPNIGVVMGLKQGGIRFGYCSSRQLYAARYSWMLTRTRRVWPTQIPTNDYGTDQLEPVVCN